MYLDGRLVATINPSIVALYFIHDDMLGTPQLATDSDRAVEWQASFDPFVGASVGDTIKQNLRFPGQYFDVESGWNHYGLRDYIPDLGRYAEPDPLGRLGSGNNLYVYVAGSPVNCIDPLGLECGCVSNASRDNPNDLALFPTEVQPKNYRILYRLRTADRLNVRLIGGMCLSIKPNLAEAGRVMVRIMCRRISMIKQTQICSMIGWVVETLKPCRSSQFRVILNTT